MLLMVLLSVKCLIHQYTINIIALFILIPEKHFVRIFLKAFLLKDERISTNEVYTTSLSPHRENTIHVTIAIYSTPNTDICYTVDKSGKYNVCKVGEVQLDLPNPDNLPRKQRQVTVTMDFSGTEIQAKAHYSITGKEVKIVCDFLSIQN